MPNKNNSLFVFVTVHGAGYEDSTCKPAEAFDMWERYTNNSWNFISDSNFNMTIHYGSKVIKWVSKLYFEIDLIEFI